MLDSSIFTFILYFKMMFRYSLIFFGTAIWLHETASGFLSTMGLTTHHPSIVLYAYSPSCWHGMTSNGWRAFTQFAPINKSKLMLSFSLRKLDIFSNIATALAWSVLLFHFYLQVFPVLYMMMVIWFISDVYLLLVVVCKLWCHLECELITFLDHLVSWYWLMFLFLLYQGLSSVD